MHVDLRSDTITKPTYEMRAAMMNSVVGDDVYEEDPTTNAIERRIASIFHKESALFFPSGTMSNLTAILTWCNSRGSEIIVGDKSHIFLFEQAGAAQFGGVTPRSVPNQPNGTMNINDIKLSIRDKDIHEPETKLICIENTHNVCGGKILPLDFMKDLKILSNYYNIPVHLDGARIWNAIIGSGLEPRQISEHVDSLSVCLSKGLGSPIGSLLVGSTDFIKKARRIRKALGGGMRQVGVLAAAGLTALNDFEARTIIFNDHERAKFLANEIKKMDAFILSDNVETNIIFFNINPKVHIKGYLGWISSKIVQILKEMGVLISAWEPFLLRIVVHRDITDHDIEHTIKSLREVSDSLL
jgi:threonine aldolase